MNYQSSVVEKIDLQISQKSLPKTMLFIGDYGSGKEELASSIASKLCIDFENITDSLSGEKMEEIQLCTLPKVYFINASDIDFREQNAILKFLEEPPVMAYIVIATQSTHMLLETVINRCVQYVFEDYPKEAIKSMTGITDEVILNYSNTPGKAMLFQSHNLQDYLDFVDKMLIMIGRASWSNILRLTEKIDFKNEAQDKLHFDVMSLMIMQRTKELYAAQQIPFCVVEEVQMFSKNSYIPKVNKVHLFENFIFKLKGRVS